MKNSFFIPVIAAAAIALGCAPATRAQVIFDNTGGATTFTPASGHKIEANIYFDVAVQFQSGAALAVDYADLSVWGAVQGIGTPFVTVSLLSDASNRPGSLLEATTLTLPPAFFDPSKPFPPQSFLRAEFANTTSLVAGSIYWLAISAFDSSTKTGWEYFAVPQNGTPFSTGRVAFDPDQIGVTDPWLSVNQSTAQSGMRLVGVSVLTPVPEPGAYGLAASLFLVSAIAFRRRRSGRSRQRSFRRD